MSPLSIYAAIALIAALASGAGVWKVQAWRYDSRELQRQETQREKERADRKSIDSAAAAHEKDKREIRTQFLTITKEVERVVEKPFYRDACLDDDGMRELRAAVGAPDAAGQPARAVPAASGAR
jgi:hypothetical protein